MHFGDMPLIGKTEILVVADHDVVVNRDAHHPAGKQKPFRDGNIRR